MSVNLSVAHHCLTASSTVLNSTGRLPCCSRHSQPTSTLINTLDGSLSNSGVSLIQLFNPFVPSVPKNGTPNLTAFIKVIQALMG